MKKLGLALIGIILSVSGHAAEKLNPFTDCGVGGMFSDKEDRSIGFDYSLVNIARFFIYFLDINSNACGGKKTEAAALIYHTYPNNHLTTNGDGHHVGNINMH